MYICVCAPYIVRVPSKCNDVSCLLYTRTCSLSLSLSLCVSVYVDDFSRRKSACAPYSCPCSPRTILLQYQPKALYQTFIYRTVTMAWLTDKETSLTEQFKNNPLNWALVALLAYMLSSFLSSSKPTKPVAMHPDTAVFRNYTPRDLQRYDGYQDGGTGRILMAVSGNVYDVSRGRNFYGPGTCRSAHRLVGII
jgi:hypothetical protein